MDTLFSGSGVQVCLIDLLLQSSLTNITDGMSWDFTVTDTMGSRICTFFGLSVAKHQISPQHPISRRFDLIYQPYSIPRRVHEEMPNRESVTLNGTKTRSRLQLSDSDTCSGVPSSVVPASHHSGNYGCAISLHIADTQL
jgi:hypothetical protein